MSAAGRALSKALDRPECWDIDEYKLTHVPSGLSFLICKGAFFFDGYENRGTPKCLGLFERHWLYAKANRVISKRRKDAVVEMLEMLRKVS